MFYGSTSKRMIIVRSLARPQHTQSAFMTPKQILAFYCYCHHSVDFNVHVWIPAECVYAYENTVLLQKYKLWIYVDILLYCGYYTVELNAK